MERTRSGYGVVRFSITLSRARQSFGESFFQKSKGDTIGECFSSGLFFILLSNYCIRFQCGMLCNIGLVPGEGDILR